MRTSSLRSVLLAALLAVLLAVLLGGASSILPTPGTAHAAETLTPPVFGGEPLEIRVSFLLLDLLRILDADQEIEVDLVYRLEWDDPRLAEPGAPIRRMSVDDVWAPSVTPLAPRSISELLEPVVMVDEAGGVRLTQRLIGSFGAPTHLSEFPFDDHTFRLPFGLTGLVGIETVVEMVEVPSRGSFSIPDWNIGAGRLFARPIDIVEGSPPIPGFAYEFHAERRLGHYLTKVIFPLVIIVMMSWAVFWAPPPQINIQFGFSATSILTVIAYRFALASQMPPVTYGTRLDAFLNGAFILAFLALIEVIVTARLIYRDRTLDAERVDRACRILFPLALVGLTLYSFVL